MLRLLTFLPALWLLWFYDLLPDFGREAYGAGVLGLAAVAFLAAGLLLWISRVRLPAPIGQV
ncbi:MAG: hypothetical protein AAF761_05260, partial [Pseudomonadota bacterium]